MTCTDNDRLVLRAGDPTTGPVTAVTPESAGWGYSGLEVRELAAGEVWSFRLDRDEAVVLPLRGGARLSVGHRDGGGDEAQVDVELHGRSGVFAGPTDFVYLPLGAQVTVTAADGARLALATARATRVLPLRVVPATGVRVDLRGAGAASRQVQSYTLGTDVAVDHLLVCEVVTPGGNWSSYPPHKHDVHADAERELEEIYYFEVADGPSGPGLAYHRTYGTVERPVEVFAEVRTGDVALVPHGFHGPCIALPGHDLYYLNVMAGPAPDGRWMSVDDPALAWVRGTWADQQVDPRLPLSATIPTTGADDDAPTTEDPA